MPQASNKTFAATPLTTTKKNGKITSTTHLKNVDLQDPRKQKKQKKKKTTMMTAKDAVLVPTTSKLKVELKKVGTEEALANMKRMETSRSIGRKRSAEKMMKKKKKRNGEKKQTYCGDKRVFGPEAEVEAEPPVKKAKMMMAEEDLLAEEQI